MARRSCGCAKTAHPLTENGAAELRVKRARAAEMLMRTQTSGAAPTRPPPPSLLEAPITAQPAGAGALSLQQAPARPRSDTVRATLLAAHARSVSTQPPRRSATSPAAASAPRAHRLIRSVACTQGGSEVLLLQPAAVTFVGGLGGHGHIASVRTTLYGLAADRAEHDGRVLSR